MPSSTFVNVSITSSGQTYIAPANGFITAAANSNLSTAVSIENQTSKIDVLNFGATNGGGYAIDWVVCKKGDQIKISYIGTSASMLYCRFTYAQGEI